MEEVLSVIVPVYNVAPYLEECLESIRSQSLERIEVIVVDDGSTDGSRELAGKMTANDPRFRLLEVEHGGLGRARNIGVSATRPTPYLAFADSDDIVTPDAYAKLVALLEKSGSDIATGNVLRLKNGELSQGWQHEGFTETRMRTHISEDQSLFTDRVAWNKVYRREFWDRHELAFPEGMLYEDSPLTIPAHFLSSATDVLHEHVYIWRLRGGSISQRLTERRGVADRIEGCRRISEFLATAQDGRWSSIKLDYDRSVLLDDLADFLDVLTDADEAFRATFVEDCARLIETFAPGILDALPEPLRAQWSLVARRHHAELLRVLTARHSRDAADAADAATEAA